MSRGLLPVLVAIFLAAAAPASAGPDDLFDARAAGALQPGQMEAILGLDDGRYTLKEGRFLDSRAVESSRPYLTNARVAELLAGKRLPSLPAAAIGSGSLKDQPAALAAKTPPTVNFDGGAAKAGKLRGPPPPNGGAKAAKAGKTDPAVLQAQLLARLKFTGNKKDREALAGAVESILKTKTGRELAAEFVKEGAVAEVTMAALGGSKAEEENGIKVLSGMSGSTDIAANPPVVTLSRAYHDTDPEFRRVAMAGTLAHELFGHAFEVQRSNKAGFPFIAHHHYRGDEVGARLIDWLVQTELAGKVVDSDPKGYLDDPEAYYRNLLTADAYYAITLSVVEMKNPLTTLRARLKLVLAEDVKTAADVKDMKEWPPVIAHFVAPVHSVAKARFSSAEGELKNYMNWAADNRKTLADIKATLEGKIASWETPDGAKEKAKLVAAADSSYLKGLEVAAAERAKSLRRLRADVSRGRGPDSPPPLMFSETIVVVGVAPKTTTTNPAKAEPISTPIGLSDLARMHSADRKKNPGHWK